MKWSICEELNINNKENIFSGEFSSIIERDIIFDVHDGLPPAQPYEYHMMNVKAFDNYWSDFPFYYVDKNLIGKHVQKRINLIRNISLSGIINAPIFDPMSIEGLQFEDGRNRFALIRDMGIEYFPAFIPVKLIQLFKDENLIVET